MSRDYYQVLGVARTASEKEIKAAFRKLTKEEHPDRHGNTPEANERFVEINEAYGVLRDSSQRAAYDRETSGRPAAGAPTGTGPAPGARAGPGRPGKPQAPGTTPGGFNYDDVMRAMFGGRPGARSRPAGGTSPSRPAGPAGTPPGPGPTRGTTTSPDDQIEVTLEEAFHGSQRTHRMLVEDACPACRGAGKSSAGLGTMQVGATCPACRGSGRKRRYEDVPVKVPAGVFEGAKLRLRAKGPLDSRGQRTDAFLAVSLKRHRLYERDAKDLTLDVDVPYTVMALGGDMTVECLAGKQQLQVPPGTRSGTKLKMPGLGIPALGSRPAGDLYVRLRVDVPRDLGQAERKLLCQLASVRGDPVDNTDAA